MFRVLAAAALTLVLVGGAQAAIVAVDLGRTGAPIQAGFDSVETLGGNATPIVTVLSGGQTLTMTPGTDTTNLAVMKFASKNRSSYGSGPRADALYDFIRVSGNWGNLDEVPVMLIEVDSLAPSTSYEVRVGSHDVWGPFYQILRAAGGTTGSDVHLAMTTPQVTPDVLSSTAIGDFTTDGNGLLSVEMVWDQAAWSAANAAAPNGIQAETQALVSYIEVVPEPATMSLLGLAGLALLRRRK